MNDTIEQFSNFVKERSEKAQARYEEIESDSKKRWQEFVKRGRAQGEDTRTKLDELGLALRT